MRFAPEDPEGRDNAWLTCITIDPAAHNTAAIRAYEKVGFQPIGIARQAERGPDGTWHDALMMDMLQADLT